ncbi:pirin family protein [Mobilicoccus sp.]|uniref:pirin family protein n=1 Tax=Mobilicoccus sp. TaxID=2034349 RepID=UPI002896B35E|nr:pirin family protein [Mobilicoccus sp.]
MTSDQSDPTVEGPVRECPADPRVEILSPREVPLGGLRAITVRRTLPHRTRSFVGAWCFVDHYGPHEVSADGEGAMHVAPHPHTGLQTVSWLFDGVIEHRDSGGVIGLVEPGAVNLMTAGEGIAHSEVTTADTRRLHGVQLWVALPDADRHTARAFDHHVPEVVELPSDAGRLRVFIGELRVAGDSVPGDEGERGGSDLVSTSPVRTFTPLLGAQLDLTAGARVRLRTDPGFEHAVLLDTGGVAVQGEPLSFGDLACLEAGMDEVVLEAGDDGARLVLLGGAPFEEEIVMWWNFVGRDHDEIVAFREAYEAGDEQFGAVPGWTEGDRIPAPPLPGVRLRPRNRHGRVGG